MGRPRTGFRLVVALLMVAAAAKPVLYDTLDPDCFWHLRVAAQLRRDGIGPVVDDLSFASDRHPWTPYSWLAELGMAAVWDAGGYRAAIAAQALTQAGIVLVLAMACAAGQQLVRPDRPRAWPEPDAVDEPRVPAELAGHHGPTPDEDDDDESAAGGARRSMAVAVATAAGTLLMLPYLSFRPVTFAVLLLAACWCLILRDLAMPSDPRASIRRGRQRAPGAIYLRSAVWAVVPLTALLANVHPSAFLVPAALLVIAIGSWIERRPAARRYAVLTAASAFASLATPMLPGLVRTSVGYATADRMVAGPVIAEMQSFARGPAGAVAAVVVIGIVACIARRWRNLGLGPALCVAAALGLLLTLGRFAPVFAVAACPLLAASIPTLRDRLLGRPAVVATLTVTLVAALLRIGLAFPSRSTPMATWLDRHGPTCPGYPCAAADFVAAHVPPATGRVVNEFTWGGYLAWRLDGRFQTLLDGRTQVFPPALWQATYLGSAADRSRFLSSVRADAAVVPAAHSLFRDALVRQGWTTAYRDDWAEVLVPPAAVARLE